MGIAVREENKWSRAERHNTGVMAAGESLWGLYTAMIAASTVLTILLHDLGAGNSVGLIPAIEGGTLLLPQVLGAFLFHGKRPVKRILITWHVVATVPFLLLAAAAVYWSASLPSLVVRIVLLLTFGCMQAIIAVVVPSWTDWLGHLFGIRHRGTVLSLLLASSALVSIGGALAAGYLIRLDPTPAAYTRHYLLAAVFAALSMVVFAWVREEPQEDAVDEAPMNKGWGHCRALLDRFDDSVRDPNTQAFMVGRCLTVCGFAMMPFMTLYYTSPSGGDLSASFVVSCGAAQALAAALSQLVLGRIGDRRGHRIGLIFGAAMQVLALAVMLAGAGPMSCLIAYFCAGCALGSASLAHLNLLIETCPHDNRVAHITINNVVLGVTSVAAPLMSSWIVQQWGLRTLFAICLTFSLVGLAWLISRMREPRHIDVLAERPAESLSAPA